MSRWAEWSDLGMVLPTIDAYIVDAMTLPFTSSCGGLCEVKHVRRPAIDPETVKCGEEAREMISYNRCFVDYR